MIKPINVKFLQDFSLSDDCRLFCGDKEINWYLRDLDLVCTIKPKNCSIPKSYTLPYLYSKTWGRMPHNSIVLKIKKSIQTSQKQLDSSFVLTDRLGVKIEFGSAQYAADFLKTSISNLREAVKERRKIKGFAVKGY